MKTRFQTMMISNEAIDHQKDNFIGVLTNLFDDLKQALKGGGIKSEHVEKSITAIQDAVYKRIGIPLSLSVIYDGNSLNAWAATLALEGINILDVNAKFPAQDMWKYRLTEKDHIVTIKKIVSGQYGDPTGSLNYKQAKVGGVFSKITAKITFTAPLILRFEPYESASVLLHELGHIWTYYEQLGIAMYRNFIISNTIKEILSVKGEEEKFKFVLDKSNIWDLEMDELMAKKIAKMDDEKFTKVMLGATSRYTASEVGFVMYNYNSSEVVADQFMARFGGTLSPELVGFTRGDYFKYLEGRFTKFTVSSLTSVVLGVLGAITGVAAAALMGLVVAVFALASYSELKRGAYNVLFVNGNTYDVGVDRYKRVRNEMVGRLKAIKDPMIQKAALQTIKDLDQIIAKYPEPKDSFGEKIVQFFYSSYNSEKAKRLLQQTIEELLANDLFVTATKFKY